MDTLRMYIVQRFDELRITYADLAKAIDVTPEHLSRYIRGRGELNSDVIERLLKVLDFTTVTFSSNYYGNIASRIREIADRDKPKAKRVPLRRRNRLIFSEEIYAVKQTIKDCEGKEWKLPAAVVQVLKRVVDYTECRAVTSKSQTPKLTAAEIGHLQTMIEALTKNPNATEMVKVLKKVRSQNE